ncbi:prepilin cleavage protein [Alteromonas sp. ASW11-19]|uniref:Prepilin cleavage protein n=1 Tax=Alteromonas salexigens TaxID=2982530 RepID=A0ABT2VQZ2_9ALTE|nr:prepilin cleavage protein [Alteromonas salexigens]MCU7555724.1 prepilin cleavage protein [Alteromonas salexigens]
MRQLKWQNGASLTELLIGMALGTAALASMASLVGYGIGVNANLLNSSRLNEEASSIFLLIEREVRRAGFSGDTINMLQDPAANPSPFANSITVSAFPGEDPNSCILFRYDANNNGVFDGGNNGENFGFRLREDQVEMRVGDLDCEALGWIALSDIDVVSIQSLSFMPVQSINGGVPTTSINTLMEAEILSDEKVSRRFESQTLVRNYDG